MVVKAEEENSGVMIKDLPIYDKESKSSNIEQKSSSGKVEDFVRSQRINVQGAWHTYKSYTTMVAKKYHGTKTRINDCLDYLHSDPAMWQRCGVVALAGLTGIVIGYRRSRLIKFRNALGLSVVSATICWPKKTVDLTAQGYKLISEPVVDLWKQYSPNSDYRPQNTAQIVDSKFYSNKPEEDAGMSKEEDNDMYTRRS